MGSVQDLPVTYLPAVPGQYNMLLRGRGVPGPACIAQIPNTVGVSDQVDNVLTSHHTGTAACVSQLYGYIDLPYLAFSL
jgi:hypothetical protein